MPLNLLCTVVIEQMLVGHDNFSYLIYCEETKLAALVDTGYDASQAMKRIGELNLDMKYLINTHDHQDHVASNGHVKNTYKCQIIASSAAGNPEIPVSHDETMSLGNVSMKFLHTPGHTPGCLCIIVDEKYLLTGDTLFIGDCGRTDLSDGSNKQMFASLQMLKSLPDKLIVYPGHDYGNKPYDTLGNQKLTNKTMLATSVNEFSKIP